MISVMVIGTEVVVVLTDVEVAVVVVVKITVIGGGVGQGIVTNVVLTEMEMLWMVKTTVLSMQELVVA
jgi:hypothetical protein